MTCQVCATVPVGADFRMVSSNDGAICVHCHQLMPGFFPQMCTYEGFTPDGLHQFSLLIPFLCPSCGIPAKKAWSECDDNGGWYEVTQDKQSEEVWAVTPEQRELLVLPFQPPLSS